MALDYTRALSTVNPLAVAGQTMGLANLGAEQQAANAERDRLGNFRTSLQSLDFNDPKAVQSLMQSNPEYMKDIATIANYGDAKQMDMIGRAAVQLDQSLSSGDLGAALNALESNRAVIDGAGDPSFTTDAAIQMLQTDPEKLRNLARGTAMASLGVESYLSATGSNGATQYTSVQFDEDGTPFGINKSTGQYEEIQGGFKRAQPKPQTVVNVGKAEGEQSKTIAKSEGEIYNQYRKDSVQANKSDAILNRLEKLSDKAFSGATAGIQKDLSKIASSLGINIDGLTETELFTALSNELVLGQTSKLTGVLTDKDMAFLEQTVPQLSQTAEGRKKLIGIMREVNGAIKEKGKLAAEFRKENKGQFDSADFDEWLQGRERKDRFGEHYEEQETTTVNAPQTAIDHLMANPGLKSQFKVKYGYLPEGM